MSADIAQLAVALELQSAQFQAGMEQVQRTFGTADRNSRKLNKSVQQLERGFARIRSVAVGMGSAIAAAFSVRAARQAIEFGDAIGKTADKLGITTTALQEYRAAAELSGVGTSALDMGLQRFTRRLGEAQQGTGVLVKVFEQYGIALSDANGNLKSAEVVLREYANVIGNTTNSSEQLALAFKAFDSEGAALVNMLRNGTEGLDELRKAAQDAGLILSDELVRKSEDLTNKIYLMTSAFRTFSASILIPLVSEVVRVAENFQKFVGALRDGEAAAKALAVAMTVALVPAMLKVAGAVRTITIAMAGNPLGALAVLAAASAAAIIYHWDKVVYFFNYKLPVMWANVELAIYKTNASIARALDEITGFFTDAWYNATKKVVEFINDVNERLSRIGLVKFNPIILDPQEEKRVGGALANAEAHVKRITDELDVMRGAAAEAWAALTPEVVDAPAQIAEQMNKAAVDTAAVAAELEKLRSRAEAIKLQDPLYNFAANMKELNELSTAGLLSWDEYAAAVERLQDSFAKGDNAASEFQKSLESAAGAIGNSMGQAFGDIVTGTAKAKDAFKSLASSVISEIAKMVAKAAAAKIVSSLFGGGGGGGFKFAKGGAGGTTGLPWGVYNSPTFFSGAEKFKAYAKGGVLGEAGPEAIMPLRRDGSGRLGVDAAPVNVNVNNYTSSDVSVTDEGDGNISVTIQKVRRALSTDIARGGNEFSGSFERAYGVKRAGA